MMVVKYFLKKNLLAVNALIDKILENVTSLDRKSIIDGCAFIDLSLIGDIIVAMPYYYKLFTMLPNSQKYFLVTKKDTSFLLRQLLLNVELDISFISVNMRKFKYDPLYRYKWLSNLPYVKYSIISHPNRTEDMEIVAIKFPSTYKIAYEGEMIYEKRKRRKNLEKFSYVIESFYTQDIVHISQHLEVLFKGIFEVLFGNITDDFELNRSDYFYVLKKALLNFCQEKDYIVVLTDTSAPYRRYPLNKWQEVLSHIPKGTKIFQIGLTRFPLEYPNLLDLTGKTSLEEAMAIVMNASLVIGNETGLTHLAYLSGVPTVCILGGGHFGRFLPWLEFEDIVKCVYKPMDCFQCGWRCKYVSLSKGKVPPCISNIPAEKIIDAIEELDKIYKIF